MKRLFLVLLLPAGLHAQTFKAAAPVEAPRIIVPGASFGPAPSVGLIVAPTAPPLSIAAPALIIPAAPAILTPAPVIVVAARPLTEEEAAPAKLPSQEDLKKLAESLAPTTGAEDAQRSDADRAHALDSKFDGTMAPEASAWNDVAADFGRGPLAPELPAVETAARSLIARLLPSLYRRVPAAVGYVRGENPETGHQWTPELGHRIGIAPIPADSRGEVPNAFGHSNAPRVQQKIEHLMEVVHEYFHVLFDSAVGRKDQHPMHSAYAAMTEGFAVSGEQLLIDRMLDMVPSLGLGPRDAADLAAVGRARRRWLDFEDNHYSEGIIAWRRAYAEGGPAGLLSLLSSLSARRMAVVSRSDPAYQLALGDPKLLGAYLGRETSSPERRGLDAFAKAAKGESLTEQETKDASAVIARAGYDGWRRLFDRFLLTDKRIKEPAAAGEEGGKWYEKKDAPVPSVEPAFALARLDPEAGAALTRYLADVASAPGGPVRLFERPGPNEKANAVIAGAEALPWDEAGRKVWNDALMRWLLAGK